MFEHSTQPSSARRAPAWVTSRPAAGYTFRGLIAPKTLCAMRGVAGKAGFTARQRVRRW